MADYRTIETGSTDERGFTLVKKANGDPITSGTVNWYLKARSGANAGQWWRISDNTWQVAETANAMTHQADGHWTRALDQTPFADGVGYLEYAKEGGDLHVPVSRWLKAGYTPSANSARRVDLGLWLGTAPLALSAQRLQALVGAMADDSITAGALADDAVSEMQSGLARSNVLANVANNVLLVLEDTGTDLPGLIAALNNLSQAQAQTAAAAALGAYDPPTNAELEARTLVSSVYATEFSVNNLASTASSQFNTILARIGTFTGSGVNTVLGFLRALARKDVAAPSDMGGTYDPTTDSNQGQTDSGGAGLTAEAVRQAVWVDAPSRTLTQSGAQVVAAVSGEAITVLRGDKLVIALTDVGSLVDRSKLWFTVKGDPARDGDSSAVLQLTEAGGLLRLNGAAYATSADGAIVVTDEEDGDLTITLKGAAARQLPVRTGMAYDVQILVDGEPVTRVSGAFHVSADVTQAVS